jgi:antitoxin MazE
MRAIVDRVGNSPAVIIPTAVAERFGLGRYAEIEFEDNAIVLRKSKRRVREAWEKASKLLAMTGDDALIWPEFANDADKCGPPECSAGATAE